MGGQEASQSAAAYERLRRAILSLDLIPGAPISERSLETMLQSSRTPIRAALARLESEGLVRREGRSYAVAPIDLEEVLHAYVFRETLECEAVRRVAHHAAPEDIARLRSLADAAAGAPEQPVMGAEQARQFHLEFSRILSNPFFLRSLESVLHLVYRARWLQISADAQDEGAQQHHAVIDLVEAGRAEEAAAAMSAHIALSCDRLVSTMRTQKQSLRGRGLRIVA